MHAAKAKAIAARALLHPNCPECVSRVNLPETYTVYRNRDGVVLAFDIEAALGICLDGRKAKLIPTEALDGIIQVNGITEEHLRHVDLDIPGIAAPVEVTRQNQLILGLIDGSHRAVRCYREFRPFHAYPLTLEESLHCQNTPIAIEAQRLETMIRQNPQFLRSSRA